MTNEPWGSSGRAEITDVHADTDRWGVVTVRSNGGGHQPEPCLSCPWVKDTPTGRFPAGVFRRSARTAYDMSTHQFGCHASPRDQAPLTCAGFLLRGATHNLSVRLHGPHPGEVNHGGRDLYESYRDMAIANGVDSDDPALAPCRDPR